MTRLRLARIVREVDGDDLWIGAVPHGPILHVEGAGAMVLAVLEGRDPLTVTDPAVGALREAPLPAPGDRPVLTAAQIVDALAADIPDLPEEADASIRDFLAQLRAAGILEVLVEADGGRA
ncbi:PqqD family peptide modification chaperone [Brachybacterium sp. YJGR34]|uniref:PqqD family peptide modification chaperone n=1 Tax=Brachybacterium sp. YJGR34 TaxID=2059911 RepID=UPI000E0BEB21|nr:PqqD family peptide modification chaperone [Brachybacterium sp. YJGR34]